jgi:hypothetical protein
MISAQTVRIVRTETRRLAVYYDACPPPEAEFAAPSPYGGTIVADGYVAEDLIECRLIATRDIWLAPVVLAIRQTELDLIERPLREEMVVVRAERDGLWQRMHAFRGLPWYVRAWRAAIGRTA